MAFEVGHFPGAALPQPGGKKIRMGGLTHGHDPAVVETQPLCFSFDSQRKINHSWLACGKYVVQAAELALHVHLQHLG
jgi:hypothetical protein